jgi:hypothetical protein
LVRDSIQVDGKKRHLGYYTSKYDGARAYGRSALELHGEFAMTNAMLGIIPKRPTSITVQLPFEMEA